MSVIPKTNLFKGDRVRLSKRFIASMEIMRSATPGRRELAIFEVNKGRLGTIVNDTLDPDEEFIRVHWDGNKCSNYHQDSYTPEDLVLVEEEETVPA